MPGTFSQIYIQIVFAIKGRENLIADSWKTEWFSVNISTIIISPRWGCPEVKQTLRNPTPAPQNKN